MAVSHSAGWTEARRAIFFATLSVTSNVTRSARAAGLTREGAYLLRRRDPDFRAQWERSLAEGYAQLELEMLHRARFGARTTVEETDADRQLRKRIVRHGYSDKVALNLLARHNGTAERERAAALGDRAGPEGQDEAECIERLRILLAQHYGDATPVGMSGDFPGGADVRNDVS